MNTSTYTFTYTHTVTFVTDKLMQSLLKIIRWSGLNPTKLTADWQDLSNAIKTWITSGHFETAVLEVFDPKNPNGLVGRWDLNLAYDFDEAEMWTDIEAIKYAIAKAGLYSSGCDYRIVISNKPGRPDVPGWGPTTFRSTAGLSKFSIGTMIGAGSLGGNTSYWR